MSFPVHIDPESPESCPGFDLLGSCYGRQIQVFKGIATNRTSICHHKYLSNGCRTNEKEKVFLEMFLKISLVNTQKILVRDFYLTKDAEVF